MKVWKKFSAIALTLVMALALCAPAFAASPTFGDMKSDTSSEDGLLGEFANRGVVANTYTDKYVLLYKEITAYNVDETTINAPTITYKYAVQAGTGSTAETPVTITDKFNVALGVTAGLTPNNVKISGAVSKANNTWSFSNDDKQLAFTPDVQLTAAPDGKKNAFPIKVDFSEVAFAAAGVYRYVITETVGSETTDAASITAKNAAGIVDGTISNVRYLDVYVKDGTPKNGNPTYDIYGFVCFQDLTALKSINGTVTVSNETETPTTGNNVTAIAKTDGFVADTNGSSPTETALTADTYYTFNVTVSKTLENDQAQNDHAFPFHVDIKNSTVTANIKLKTSTVTNSDTATTPADEENTANLSATNASNALVGIARTPTIDHQSKIKYIGIPVGVTGDNGTVVTVYEENDVTGTTYFSKYKVDTDTESTAKSLSWKIANVEATTYTSETATLTVTKNAADTKVHTIAFTNTLMNISPTGVVLRYAPYMAMMGAGIVALPLSLRKKEELF